MTPRTFHRAALLPLLAAGVLAACSDQLPSDAAVTPPTRRLTLTPTNAFVQIDGGLAHACGLTSGGQAWCWGRNNFGQLGDGSAAATLVPVATSQGGLTFTLYSAGNSHGCALDSTGAAYCWGYNADGRLGDGTFVNPLAPVAVQGGLSFITVSAGGSHTCALDSGGQAYCWGNNAFKQIGDGTTTFALAPTAVSQPLGVAFVSIQSGDKHTCALDTGGQAWCWGYGGDGAIGNNSLIGPSTPAAVSQPVGVTFTAVFTEYNHSCGLDAGGQAYCWGLNANGQLGDNTPTRRLTPVAVSQGGVTFVTLAPGATHTCGLTGAGQAYRGEQRLRPARQRDQYQQPHAGGGVAAHGRHLRRRARRRLPELRPRRRGPNLVLGPQQLRPDGRWHHHQPQLARRRLALRPDSPNDCAFLKRNASAAIDPSACEVIAGSRDGARSASG